jgi:hypothetical protein
LGGSLAAAPCLLHRQFPACHSFARSSSAANRGCLVPVPAHSCQCLRTRASARPLVPGRPMVV